MTESHSPSSFCPSFSGSEPEIKTPLEIERKWLVKGWPPASASLPLLKEELMRQGYLCVEPTVRIREETLLGETPAYILCFKSRGNGLTRKEIEFPIAPENFRQLEDLIGLPLIPKLRRTYLLPDGHHLEVNAVDKNAPTAFFYAEVEFSSEKEARCFSPDEAGLGEYLQNDVTSTPGMTMGAYWKRNRLGLDA